MFYPQKLHLIALFIYLLTCVCTTAEEEPKKIIYTSSEKQKMDFHGYFGHPSDNKKRFAFLVPSYHIFTTSMKNLIAPQYVCPVSNGKFHFQFVSKGKYILGVFIDLNNNKLLDLGTEPFTVYPESPIKFHGQSMELFFSENLDLKQTVNLSEYPDVDSYIVQVFNENMNPLYVQSFEPPTLILSNLPTPCRIGFTSDQDNNGRIDPHEFPELTYSIPSNDISTYNIRFNQEWHPCEIELTEWQPSLGTYQIRNLATDEITKLPDSEHSNLYHLEPGEYQAWFIPKNSKQEIPGQVFSHPSNNQTYRFTFHPKFSIKVNPKPQQNFMAVLANNSLVASFPATDLIRVYQPGQYQLVIFDDFDGNSELDLLQPTNKNVQIHNATITTGAPQKNIHPSSSPVKGIRGIYRMYSRNYTSGFLFFFRATAIENVFDMITHYPLRKTGKRDYIRVKLKVRRDETFYAGLDFNGNMQLDKDEAAFIREYHGKEFRGAQNYMDIPFVNAGQAIVSLEAEQPENYFAEILSPLKDEVIASSFLGYEPVLFKNLPLQIELKVRVTHDINGNQEFDPEDVPKQPITFQIPRIEGQTDVELKY
jgi:uncharacterized protein (DUF2141 family)